MNLKQIKKIYIENKYQIVFFLVIISLLLIIILYKYEILIDIKFTLVQLLGGISVCIAIYYWDNRAKNLHKQIESQEKTRKDQQFIDAVKLIENGEYDSVKLAGLSLLENLAKENIEYRQRVIDYLGIYTEEIRNFLSENFNFEEINELHNDMKFNDSEIIIKCKEEIHFNYQCLISIEKIINFGNYIINISNIFLPLLKIMNNKIIAKNALNLFAVKIVTKYGKFTETVSIGNHSIYEDLTHISSTQTNLICTSIFGFKEFNTPPFESHYNKFYYGKINLNRYENIKFDFPELDDTKINIYNFCDFGGIVFKCDGDETKQLIFNNCEFLDDNSKFENMRINDLKFKNCRITSPINGLENITILTKDMRKIKRMANEIYLIRKQNSNIQIPKSNNEILKKEILKLEKK